MEQISLGVIESATLHIFERKLDYTWKEHESKFDFKSDCSLVANKQAKLNTDDTHAEDLVM